jgi:hypothetical protein
MRTHLLSITILFLLLFTITGNAQIKIGANPTTIGASSLLELESTTKGMVFPRMTGVQMNAITSPVSGMFIFNSDSLCICHYNGTAWRSLCGGNTGAPFMDWHVIGNTGTTASTAAIGSTINNNFIGTTDTKDFVLASNNLERIRIASGGNVGIGVVVPSEALSFNGDALKRIAMERNSVANTAGNFLTLKSGGATIGATDKNGGNINLSSGISTGTGTSNISFFTATAATTGTADNAATQKMTILGNGNVGIGITTPVTNLNVHGATAAAPNTSGTISTAILRLDAQNNALDIGAYSASPWGNWMQATAVADLSTKLPLALNPNGGYIGIGTAAPTNHLEIVNNAGSSGADDDLAIKSYGSTLNPQLFFQTAAGTLASPTNLSNGTDLGSISWWGQINSTGTLLNKISSTLTGTGTDGKSDFRFTTSGVEHMRLDSIGRMMLACNTTSFAPKTSLHMYGDGTSGYALGGTTLIANPAEGPEIAFGRGGFTTNPGAAIQFIDYDAFSGGLAFLVHKGQRNNATGAFADNWPTDVLQAMTIVNNGQIGIGTSDPTAKLHIMAGAAAAESAPLKLTDGVLLTAIEKGTIEKDANVFYGTPDATNRGLLPTISYSILSSDFTLGNVATAQAVFSGTQDVINVSAATTYEFEAQYILSTGATTHTTATLFAGTATLTGISYVAELTSSAANTITTTISKTNVNVATVKVLNATSTNVETVIQLMGIIRVNAAGTLIPQIQFSANPTGTNKTLTNSYIKLTPIGTNTVQSIGSWN